MIQGGAASFVSHIELHYNMGQNSSYRKASEFSNLHTVTASAYFNPARHNAFFVVLMGLAAAWPNVGYMGLPLVITAFGEKATLPAVLIIVFDALVTLSIAIALVEAGLGRGGRWLDVAQTVGSGLARNPLLLSIFAGALVSVSGFSLHPSVGAFGTLLGAAALPCALFSL